jgi:hypothetical protein
MKTAHHVARGMVFTACIKRKKKKLRRQWKPLPTSIKEKEPLWYRVPYSSSTAKRKWKINGDQEDCRLGLKPAPDESW